MPAMSFSSSLIAELRSGEDANIIHSVDTHLASATCPIFKLDSPSSQTKGEEDDKVEEVGNGDEVILGTSWDIAEEEERDEDDTREREHDDAGDRDEPETNGGEVRSASIIAHCMSAAWQVEQLGVRIELTVEEEEMQSDEDRRLQVLGWRILHRHDRRGDGREDGLDVSCVRHEG